MERPIAQISSAGSGPGKISHTYDLRYLLNRHNLDSASPDEAFRRIVDGIWSTIDRDSWQRCGGTREDLRLVHGRLTVAIAPENLFALDNALRAAFSRRSLGVAIECRAMVIPADALKELGADWRLSPMAR